jgi:signal transduction histidine kinase
VAERRTTSIDARWTQLLEIIPSTLLALASRYGANGVRLESRTLSDLPDLWVGAYRCGQVFGNRLDNALRHTRAGGLSTATEN